MGTMGTMYYQMALSQVPKFATYGINLRFVPTPNKGRLAENIFERTHAMLRIAKENPKEAVGWVDADVELMQFPQLIADWDEVSKDWDLACTCRPDAENPSHRHCCGVVLWPAGGGKGLEWFSRILDGDDSPQVGCREQWYLSREIKRLGLRVFDLGEQYNDPGRNEDTIIHHSDAAVKPQHDLTQWEHRWNVS